VRSKTSRLSFGVCHLRFDMLAPDGPLPFAVPGPTDDLVAPAVEFMLAGLPQMQGPELDATVGEPLVLDLTAPAPTTATVPLGPTEDCASCRVAVAQHGSAARLSASSPGAQPESPGAITARSLATHPRQYRSWTASTSSDDWTSRNRLCRN